MNKISPLSDRSRCINTIITISAISSSDQNSREKGKKKKEDEKKQKEGKERLGEKDSNLSGKEEANQKKMEKANYSWDSDKMSNGSKYKLGSDILFRSRKREEERRQEERIREYNSPGFTSRFMSEMVRNPFNH